MPVYKSRGVRGRLFVKVDIDLPDELQLDDNEMVVLKSILSKMEQRDDAIRQPKS